MTDKQIIKALLAMLKEAHNEVWIEINAVADDENPMMAGKIKTMKRHEAKLKKMGLA